MQTKNPLFDDISRLAGGAMGFAQTVGEEARTLWQSKLEQLLVDMDLVRRDEYDILADRLKVTEDKLSALEAKFDEKFGAEKPKTTKTNTKAATAKSE